MSRRRSVKALVTTLASVAVAACGTERHVSNDIAAKHEIISSGILSRKFSDLTELTIYLDDERVKYVLEEDVLGKELPQNTSISWNQSRNMYYLVLLPRDNKKLFRFRVYETNEGGLHLESDFAYRNPYQ
jgi:hypothetical protein